MILKIKFLKWSAGRPVAILHQNFADKASIHVDGRVTIKKDLKKIIAVVDTAKSLLKENEIAVSSEITKQLNLKENNLVEVEIAQKPRSLNYINKKLNNKTLSKSEIEEIIQDIVNNALTEAEISYFVSGVYINGLSEPEIVDMINAIVNSGKRLKIKNKVIVDKHSIGGVPGRITPIVVSICSAAGLTMPKTSSRAITTPAGTADAVEVLCRVDFSVSEIKKIINKTNACMVWGGPLGLAPADDKIIQVERLLKLDPESQLLTSILAKKIAVNAKYVLIHIPYGKNMKVNKKQGLELAKKFKKLAHKFGIKLECILIDTEEPIGNGIGPALEIQDAITVLKRQDSCHNLEKFSLLLAGKILEMTGKARKDQGVQLARQILNSGNAFEKFKQIIIAQEGNLNNIRKAKYIHTIRTESAGRIIEVDTKKLNDLARATGCPLDKFSGIYLHKHLSNKIKKGEKLMTLYSDSRSELKSSLKLYKTLKPIKIKR